MTGYLHSIETLGTADGPGIRTVFFLQGCKLRCRYCHNPDTWAIGSGRKMNPEEVRNFAVRYQAYYGDTGGVTFSGGEPLLQAAFLSACTRLIHEAGINVYIDTAGSVTTPAAREAIRAADGILLDVKHTDGAAYTALSGGKLLDTLDTLAYSKENKKKTVIRQVIVPGINDDAAQVKRLKEIAGDTEIELLPYHTLGVHKWELLGMPYPLTGTEPPGEERMRELRKIVREKARG